MNRTVLVTGASSGIGEACARTFAAAGDRVVLAARRRDRLQRLGAELGTGAIVATLDVCDRAAVQTALASLAPPFDAVDVLVNAAGLALGRDPIHLADPDDGRRMVETNINGMLHMVQAVLPGMVARGRGDVVLIGSIAGSRPYAGGNVYGGTKAFVAQLAANLRAELRGTGVRATLVEPGTTSTEIFAVRFKGDMEKARAATAGLRPLSPGDVAEAVRWCIDRPAHVTLSRLEIMPSDEAPSLLGARIE
ncbi:MAG: SDR family NAD(P)-dependent oxidoreductase [Alphaproteobacteria bacterium]|nr:SDR family NAD(P)-dependent oxidoreductase [Alphaproteobacteria bacterium]